MLDSSVQDVRYAARLLRRNPLFSLTAALSLAIGIGANTTIFTIANALLFRPPAGVADPARIVDVGRTQDGAGFDTYSYPNYVDIRERNHVFTDVYAHRGDPTPISLGGDGAERIYAGIVTTNYFTALAVRPHLGRLFAGSDSESPVVVLSHRFWVRRFGADPSIAGRSITLNGRSFAIVGVAAQGFHGTSLAAPDVWTPMGMVDAVMPRLGSILTSRGAGWLLIGARLKPGVSLRQAQAELDTLARALEREYPDRNRGKGLRVVPSSPIPGNPAPVAAFLAMLMGVVGLVLAIACVNVAGVLLARAESRRREIAVRLAIGAARAQLIRQLLVETMLLFAIGAAAGLLVARGMTTTLVSLLPTLPVPVDVSLSLDRRAVTFTAVLSWAAAIVSGLAPAFHASKTDVWLALKADAIGRPGRLRLRNAFVIAQVALSIMLVVGAALFVRALDRAASIDPGFDARGVELASIDLSLSQYTDATGPAFGRQLVERVRALPGVQSATLMRVVPLGGSVMSLGGLAVPGQTPPNGRPFFDADWNIVEPGVFATLKMALIAGRDFAAGDRVDASWVAILNETAARRFFPGQDPIGKVILQQTGGAADSPRPLTIVGVVRDAKYRSLGDSPKPFVFVPFQQQYSPRMTIVARSTLGQRLASEIRALVTSLDPNLPIVSAQTLEDYTSIGLVPQRVAASVSGSLGIVGLLLAAIGIYGVTAYMVSSRTREIGIRMALGAQHGDVVRMVLRQGMMLALAGVAIGLALSAALSRLLGSLLFGIGPTDPLAFGGSAALFCTIGLIACYVPARRATAIEATEALRYE